MLHLLARTSTLIRLAGFLLFVCAAFAAPLSASAATLYLSPSSASVAAGGTVSVSVLVGSADQPMNAVSGTLSFSKDTLEVASVSKSGSIVSFWASEPVSSNSAGTISFEGVVLGGYTGGAGKIITVTFKGKSAGPAGLSLSGASVLANDGQGSEILSGTSGGSITVGSASVISTPEADDAPAPAQSAGAGVAITSPTHPDQAKWYKSDSPKFEWKLPEGALEVRLLLDEKPKSTPTVRYPTPISSRTVTNLDDGTHYFHLQVRTAEGWSAASHFQVNIDTKAPKRFQVDFPHGTASLNPQPVILFNTEDDGSGIEYYDVKVGEGGPLRTVASADSNPYALPLLDPGTYAVVVTAYDRAGNSTAEEAEFTVEGIEAPKITEYPETMTVGDILRIRGTTYPNASVDITVSDENGVISTETTKSNSLGDFGFIFSKRLGPDEYTFTARVTDDRGARSLPTESFAFTVGLHLFSDALAFVTNYFLIAVAFLLALAGIAAAGIWSAFKLMHLTRTLRKESIEAETTMHKSFAILKHDLETHIRRFKRAKRRRDLTDEELLFLEQFEQDLKEAEHLISDQMKDIPKP